MVILEGEDGVRFLEQLAKEENIKEPVWKESDKLKEASKKILKQYFMS